MSLKRDRAYFLLNIKGHDSCNHHNPDIFFLLKYQNCFFKSPQKNKLN